MNYADALLLGAAFLSVAVVAGSLFGYLVVQRIRLAWARFRVDRAIRRRLQEEEWR